MDKVVNLLFFSFYLLLNPRLLKPLFKGLYIPVFVQYEWLKDFSIKTFVDVGTYKGLVTQTFNYLFPKSTIYSFEPTPMLFKSLKEKFRNRNIKLFDLALSNKVGTTDFHTLPQGEFSSLLDFETNKIKEYKVINKPNNIKVKTTTLDSFFKDKRLQKPTFLKVDTQGTEGLILKAGKNFLKEVDYIHVEMAYEVLYKKEPLFKEVYNFLSKEGFTYKGQLSEAHFYPIFSPNKRANCLFVRERQS